MESRTALSRRTSDAEERAEVAEAKGSRLASYYRKQAARREEIADIVLAGAGTVAAGTVVHGLRRAVDLEVWGIDLGGVAALGIVLTAGLGGGGKYARLIGAGGAGVALEYAIHKMDKPAPAAEPAGMMDEEVGNVGAASPRRRVTQILKPARRGRAPLYGANTRTIDADFEEIPSGAPGGPPPGAPLGYGPRR